MTRLVDRGDVELSLVCFVYLHGMINSLSGWYVTSFLVTCLFANKSGSCEQVITETINVDSVDMFNGVLFGIKFAQ